MIDKKSLLQISLSTKFFYNIIRNDTELSGELWVNLGSGEKFLSDEGELNFLLTKFPKLRKLTIKMSGKCKMANVDFEVCPLLTKVVVCDLNPGDINSFASVKSRCFNPTVESKDFEFGLKHVYGMEINRGISSENYIFPDDFGVMTLNLEGLIFTTRGQDNIHNSNINTNTPMLEKLFQARLKRIHFGVYFLVIKCTYF
jgi:hypothetical protein